MLQLLPLGEQNFETLREEGLLYVDKTALIYRLTHMGSKFVFLSRPRRFGKSLLVSTLKAYFQGRRELFKGLAAEDLEKEWNAHPVLHFDFSTIKDVTKETLEGELNAKLLEYERLYGRDAEMLEPNQRLGNLIKRANEQTGKKVVLLVDEYDAPLLEVMQDEALLAKIRTVMRNFYAPLKACSGYLRFVFLTGITKVSQLSIFSELNNIKNVSMLPEFAALCGIAEPEMTMQLSAHIEALAKELEVPHEEAVLRLKEMYDGYRFAWPSPGIYNPYSLLNALSDCKLGNYWFASGTPGYLVELLGKVKVPLTAIEPAECAEEEFDVPIERNVQALPLLYQSGYLTIKNYDKASGLYTLAYPNAEVRVGMTRSLLSNYVENPGRLVSVVLKMNSLLAKGELDGTFRLMQQTFATVPYCAGANTEGHYQAMMVLMFKLLGQEVEPEIRTAKGRIDLVLWRKEAIYLMELKLCGTAQEALAQIDERRYAEKFALDNRPVVKVGLAFDVEKRTLGEWVIA